MMQNLRARLKAMLATANTWSLATQFAVAGGIVMLVAMLVVGAWVAARIEETVVRNSAAATAQYLESFISPLSQDLAQSDTLSPGAHLALDEVFSNTALGNRLVSYKIWKDGGLVVDASDHVVMGKRFEVTEGLAKAWAGEVWAKFDALGGDEDAGEAALGLPLLEIYSPIREVWSGKVIGVVEVYEIGTALRQDLVQAQLRSWGTVAAVMLSIGAALYGIVLRGSRTIDRQRAEMARHLAELADLSGHNTALRLRVQGAAARSAAMHDQALRQLGADLHDGPAQLLGFAALRLDGLRNDLPEARAADMDQVERAVKDAIREVRNISRGVSLPDIEERCPCEILRGVVDAHEARSGTTVELRCDPAAMPALPAAVKTCLFRFAQEGLNNAWRHADGAGQTVDLTVQNGMLELRVSDGGPGFTEGAQPSDEDGGLGLTGLRDRVEALGGVFELRNRTAGGAELRMSLDLAQDLGRE